MMVGAEEKLQTLLAMMKNYARNMKPTTNCK